MKKVALIAFIFFIIGIVGSLTFSRDVFSMKSENTIQESKVVDGEAIESVEIIMDVGKVNVTESIDDSIHIELKGKSLNKQLQFDVIEDDEKLTIETRQKDKGFQFNITSLFRFNESLQLDVQLPAKTYQKVDVKTGVGQINIDYLTINELIASSDVGAVHIEGVISERAVLKSNVGKVDVRQGVGAFTIETDTGKVEMDMVAFTDDIMVKTDVGEAEVSVQEQPTSLLLSLQSNVGDVSVKNLDIVSEMSGKSYYKKVGSGSPKVHVQTDVGKVSVIGR
ncbi:DUF4097 family beta strand repeat-containing protein [Aquibacillus albus]|uniref:DUF4097 and DUF4098 domain-containing protein YvlB n=1 Tax=Aquibacillus albus TaxID=1168171 RepID=A0ABS2MXD1_9BACI|nr:DUF4097 family beta strand repeat-containing protein [Aquibacillus albus]MBM7570544.1 DUF4097 and DUF4098 domain-containing protein YvlB [Aquibacillus albus]